MFTTNLKFIIFGFKTSECTIVFKSFIVFSGPNPVWLKQNCLLVIHGGYLWFRTNKINMNPL